MKQFTKSPSSWTKILAAPFSSAWKNIVVILLLFFGTINLSNAQWTQLNPGIMISFKGVSFINSDTGIVVGANGNIIKTTDGGETWIQKVSTTTQELRKIQFLNDNVGYVVGNQCILKTTDGGETWTNVIPAGTHNCYSLSFLDVDVGYVKTDYDVLKTIDGGTNWTITNVDITNPGKDGICFINQDTGFVIGYIGVIKKTIDGGDSWVIKNSTVSQNLESIYFSSDTIGYIGGAGGTILKTTDGGETWININTIFSWSMPEIHFINNDTGFVVSNWKEIAKTTDGGSTWSVYNFGMGTSLSDIYFTNENTGYVVGNGVIYKTTNGGDCSSTSIISITPLEFNLYPNPAQESITIETTKKIVNVSCYNLMGQLLLETQDKVLNISHLSSGTYIIRVMTEDGVSSQKIIVQ